MPPSAPAPEFRRKHLARLALFVLSAILILVLLNVSFQAINTLDRLKVVEAERDQWQRPGEVIQALGVRNRSAVVDLGCGAGYFALKLSRAVGDQGSVVAEDIRRLPLTFLWIRAVLDGRHNLHVVHGAPDDPRLAVGSADAVLIANTYHELSDRRTILDQVSRALRTGGRLVIVDRGEGAAGEAQHHELSPAVAEDELRRYGFEIVSRQDRFIERSDAEQWWLIVSRKP
jgi:ubiquinone/menaquinone biosynthesis C-methylase UbiE